jgi:hypothetical protein
VGGGRARAGEGGERFGAGSSRIGEGVREDACWEARVRKRVSVEPDAVRVGLRSDYVLVGRRWKRVGPSRG